MSLTPVTRNQRPGAEGYKGGGEICPTLTAGQTEIYYFEDETDGDTDMGAERGGEGEEKDIR